MKQRFYLDTSVFGGVFDKEFDEFTLQLFERIKLGKVTFIYSELVETELVKAPKKVSIKGIKSFNFFGDTSFGMSCSTCILCSFSESFSYLGSPTRFNFK